jgi:hypothetical protein
MSTALEQECTLSISSEPMDTQGPIDITYEELVEALTAGEPWAICYWLKHEAGWQETGEMVPAVEFPSPCDGK